MYQDSTQSEPHAVKSKRYDRARGTIGRCSRHADAV